MAFDVYLSGSTDQYLRIFTHVLHSVRPPTAVLAILWLALPGLSQAQGARFVHFREIETLRRGKVICALAAHPVEHLAERSAERFAKRLPAEVPRLLLRKLANGEVRLLLASASFTEGYTPDLHHRLMETWALRTASDLARSLLRHCIDKENLPPKILRTREPLLVIRTPPVSTPATNRTCTLRKSISSLETGVASVRQAYDGRPVRSRRRLLGCFLGPVGPSLHFRSFLRPWLFHQCQPRFLFLTFCRYCYYYIP